MFITKFKARMAGIAGAVKGENTAGRPGIEGQYATHVNVLIDLMLHVRTMGDDTTEFTDLVDLAAQAADYEWSMVGEQLVADRNGAS